jgi:hypothetical protein
VSIYVFPAERWVGAGTASVFYTEDSKPEPHKKLRFFAILVKNSVAEIRIRKERHYCDGV